MGKRRKYFIFVASLLLLGILALPTLLRAIPPRYAARWLPEPLLVIASPQQEVDILPTVARPLDISSLLAEPTGLSAPVVEVILPTATVSLNNAAPEPTAVPPTATPSPIPTATAVPIPESARLEGIQHHFQDWNNCGPATLAMTLSYFQLYVTQSDTAAVLKPNPEDRNVSPDEMAAYVNDQTPYRA
jgi:hypothetical protein